jgi:hypothetical protein
VGASGPSVLAKDYAKVIKRVRAEAKRPTNISVLLGARAASDNDEVLTK